MSEKEYWNVYYASSPLKREIQEALPNVYVAYGENQYRLNYAALKRLPSDVDEAIAQINYNGSRYSSAIFTTSSENASKFIKEVKSKIVTVNTSPTIERIIEDK